ncbi:hypothetical protein IMCC12053_60 [Celeribacter marinus]|uniref:Uncharacterized protein n=1 Tax=Celeribacter marinus TaxID=1397108 RepID=A0A0N9ZLA0_9RHOB|nr:hypothetical protein IMCC12053_60 [Celeribacter marinus]
MKAAVSPSPEGWSGQVRGERAAQHFFQFLQRADLKEVSP